MSRADWERKTVSRYMNVAPVQVQSLIEELGISYIEEPSLHKQISGELERLPNDEFVIRVNASHGERRRRFTAAHELGHYMLHRSLVGKGVDDNKAFRSDLKVGHFKNSLITKKHETEANKFAASLLMPSGLLNKDVKSNGADVGFLSNKYHVSSLAMEIRLQSLGLLDAYALAAV